MATYKVIQDIEAEDKFLGPLTLKQFIFAAITVVCAYLSFFFITKHVWFLVLPLLPIMLVSGFLAFPWGRDQPTETWLLAKVRFFLKPHLRIWDQTGQQELVTITAPKKQPDEFTSDNLTQTEIKSRLKALAETIDSRGWAVKNANLNMVSAPGFAARVASSDRLVDISTSNEVPIVDIKAADDILDEKYNPVAQQLNEMIKQSAQTHRQQTIEKMKAIAEGKLPSPIGSPLTDRNQPDNFWFMEQPATPAQPGYATFDTQAVANIPTEAVSTQDTTISAEEKALLDKIHKRQAQSQPASYGHMKVINPLSANKTESKKQKTSTAQPTISEPAPSNPEVLRLADNNDLTVATIARQAKKDKQTPEDEVVINLH